MTALRAIVGVCSKYVKVSERHVLLVVRFGFTRLVVVVVLSFFLALRRSPTISVVKRCPSRSAIAARRPPTTCIRFENILIHNVLFRHVI